MNTKENVEVQIIRWKIWLNTTNGKLMYTLSEPC